MAEEKEIQKVADRMRNLCSRREYCRADIMKKALTALDGDAGAASEIVETLVSEKYIDDLRYASAFARDKASIAGWGAVKIRYMLSSKGIAKDVIGEALAEIDEAKASGRLQKAIDVKAKSLKGDPQIRLKLLRFALGRGYCYEEAETAVSKSLKMIENE